MRLDKFLVECGIGSRKEVKKLISNNEITVNGISNISAKDNIDENSDIIEYNEEKLEYKKFRYYIMNKKSGYITATEDFKEDTVMDLLPEWVIKKDLVPVGRLDKDTEGLLLFTNDGKLNHKLLSPKNHVDKVYYVEIKNNISDEDIFSLEKELTSNNKSVLTYYELGMIKLMKSSKQDAKKVFLEGINFDNAFAPMYYNLALIERQEGNYSKSKEYAQKAYDLEKVEKYKNLVDELNND